MRAADSNLIIRLIAEDNAQQTAAASELIGKGLWISVLPFGTFDRALGRVPGTRKL